VQKWLAFDYQGDRTQIQGVVPDLSNVPKMSLAQLEKLQHDDSLWCILEVFLVKPDSNSAPWPEDIQLPPNRSHSHTIPFIPGAQPFRLRPYRFNPSQKDEIEKQVLELLQNGMIQESASPFASPVLLVKKKSGEWRMCVDYRRLNSMTIKNRYPMPVMEEFLDELHGACWFSSLDLRSRFNQIRVNPADQYKTAFQTHNDHYEYRVMPYGVTGGPATFQHIMNSVLAPFLRKCVVVFIDDILIYNRSWKEHLTQVKAVFQVLQLEGFKIKLSKCLFAQQ
jgi:hypothetical protein